MQLQNKKLFKIILFIWTLLIMKTSYNTILTNGSAEYCYQNESKYCNYWCIGSKLTEVNTMSQSIVQSISNNWNHTNHTMDSCNIYHTEINMEYNISWINNNTYPINIYYQSENMSSIANKLNVYKQQALRYDNQIPVLVNPNNLSEYIVFDCVNALDNKFYDIFYKFMLQILYLLCALVMSHVIYYICLNKINYSNRFKDLESHSHFSYNKYYIETEQELLEMERREKADEDEHHTQQDNNDDSDIESITSSSGNESSSGSSIDNEMILVDKDNFNK